MHRSFATQHTLSSTAPQASGPGKADLNGNTVDQNSRDWPSRGFNFGDWSVIPAENSIRRDDRRVRLEPKVMQLLLTLVAQHDEPCSRDELMDRLWPAPDVGESALSRAMCELRKALGDRRSHARYIETIQNIGYRVIAPVRPLATQRLSHRELGSERAMSEVEDLTTTVRYLLDRENLKDLRLACDVLVQQLESRPDQAQTSALLAHAELRMIQHSKNPPALHLRGAREHAERALQLDGANSMAWAVLAALAHGEWRWSEALRLYGRARGFKPSDPLVLQGYAQLLMHQGRIEPAREMMRRASRLRPTAACTRLALAWVLMHGEEKQALAELSKARQFGAEPRHCDNLECLILHREGWSDNGIRRWAELNQVHVGHPHWLWPSYLLDVLIDGQTRPATVNGLSKRVLLGHLDAGLAPFMLTLLGDLDGAFELAEIAIERRRLFSIDPWLEEMDPFRADPRFNVMKRAVGLDEFPCQQQERPVFGLQRTGTH